MGPLENLEGPREQLDQEQEVNNFLSPLSAQSGWSLIKDWGCLRQGTVVAVVMRMTSESQERPGGGSGLRKACVTGSLAAVFQENQNASRFTSESFPSQCSSWSSLGKNPGW